MITRLKGELIEKKSPHLCIDVQGVGYHVLAPMSTIYCLPQVGETVVLHIHHWVREDAQVLYGFSQPHERELFRQLIKTNGVGPKMALTLLSGMSPHEFITCIQRKDVVALVRLPGVGKKTAERLVVEMTDRLEEFMEKEDDNHSAYLGVGEKNAPSSVFPKSSVTQDAISALVALGYDGKKANQIIRQCATPAMDSEALIREALKVLV
ncbi:MAG: Holliday junction branch migration protein RuvA [Gammaproteobacteria bacterium]